MAKEYDVVIVGAGVAGMTAAIYVRRANKSVIVLDSKTYGGQIINTSNVANWPGIPGVSGVELSQKIYHQMKDLGADFEYEDVLEIVPEAAADSRFLVKTDEGEYSCGAVILAMGTEPRKLSEEQAASAGKRPISYCAICDGSLYKDKTVVVVGSGKTAEHEMKYLSNIAAKVLHIHHDEPIPEEADAVFAAIGRVPGTEKFARLVELDSDGYVVADEDCITSRPGVFVAGDCRRKPVRQLVTAAGDGATAATMAVRFLK